MYTDLHTGALTQPAELTAEQWRDLVDGQSQLGKLVAEQFDVRLGFHPHVDTQQFIDKFLDDTDPEFVSLCLDTAMVEPPLGAPAMQPLLDDLAGLSRDLRLMIEQDMYPAPEGSAKAIAARTRDYFTTLGLPPAKD
jgi:inosose dehydratase